MTARIDACFAKARAENRPVLVTYTMAGDPDAATSLDILKQVATSGADIVEFGLPFTDPVADGPAIQVSGLRALDGGQTTKGTLDLVREFRKDFPDTPVILMGYYNPIYSYGPEKFVADAKDAGVDGMIIVDLPAEEDDELCLPAMKAGLAFIRLVPPTADDDRLPVILKNSSGFVYHVSINGITGAATPDYGTVGTAIERIRKYTDLPIVVGFGVKTGEHAAALGAHADGVVVGTALINQITGTYDANEKATEATVPGVGALVEELAAGVRRAAKG
jgi:tryptophan synthase alpha chain